MPSSRLSEGEVDDFLKLVNGNPSAIGDTALVAAPGVGYKIVVYGYQAVAAAANTLTFRSAANAKTSPKALAANGALVVGPTVLPLFECSENEALNINLSAATAVGIDVQYVIAKV